MSSSSSTAFDFAIIGGGIVGLATAFQLSQKSPDSRLVIIEKEKAVALHQTAEIRVFSIPEFIISPGSLKAQTCLEGKRLMENFCNENSIPWNACGKVIVAVDEKELPALDKIYQKGIANKIDCERIDARVCEKSNLMLPGWLRSTYARPESSTTWL